MLLLNVMMLLLLFTPAVLSEMSSIDREHLLLCHNQRRAELAAGRTPGQPPAADMTLLDYDMNLEATAVFWNDKCVPDHDKWSARMPNDPAYKTKFTWVNQNWAGYTNGPANYSCDMWWKENLNYDFQTKKSKNGKLVGHFTQMVWAGSTAFGCGYRTGCVKAYGHHVTCNYVPGGNYNGAAPYKVGESCSQCPDGYPFCLNHLCARRDQCANAKETCECTLNCSNNGSLDISKCRCSCPDTFYGDRCQNECLDTHRYCQPPWIIDCAKSYWRNLCNKRCKNCVSAAPFIPRTPASSVAVGKQVHVTPLIFVSECIIVGLHLLQNTYFI